MPGMTTVACKLPHGLILQLQKPEKRQEAVMGGGFRDVTRYERFGKAVRINGYAHAVDKAPHCAIKSGFALTPNVDADFFAEWMKQNADHPAVEGGFIFASAKRDEIDGHTKDYATARNGLEPCDSDNLPPEFARKITKKKDD